MFLLAPRGTNVQVMTDKLYRVFWKSLSDCAFTNFGGSKAATPLLGNARPNMRVPLGKKSFPPHCSLVLELLMIVMEIRDKALYCVQGSAPSLFAASNLLLGKHLENMNWSEQTKNIYVLLA